jgi:hypothetical protein
VLRTYDMTSHDSAILNWMKYGNVVLRHHVFISSHVAMLEGVSTELYKRVQSMRLLQENQVLCNLEIYSCLQS